MGSRAVVVLAAAGVAAPASSAAAAGQIDAERVVVTTAAGTRATVTRTPLRIAFADSSGRTVLAQLPGTADSMPVAPLPQSHFGTIAPPPPSLYAPLTFLVGSHSVSQFPASQWQGVLQSVTEGGVEYRARDVADARQAGDGARLETTTTDPSGRRLVITIAPIGDAGGLRVEVRPTPADGVATMADSFASPSDEAFRGFGGRHNSLDQRGSEFYDWLQQENVSSGSADGITKVSQPGQDRYMFPNGQHAAYYVQSSFVSPGRYGFLLDRDEISHWRLDSDRPDAWQVEAAAPALDYVVVPGDAPAAIAGLTTLTGRQPVPPAWAVGPIMDRLVKYPSDPPDQHAKEIEGDLRDLLAHDVALDGYRIEGWQFLPRATLERFIGELRDRGIHPMVYFRLFVGKDEIGTDDPKAYDEALAKGYVATHADGPPYVFPSNFNKDGAVIHFPDPAAVAWWQGRIRAALDLGADGFMQDFGEQVLADMHFADGETGISMHNRLSVLYHRATREVVDAYEREHPGRKIFFYTRAGYTGTPGAAA